MSHEHNPQYVSPVRNTLRTAMSRDAQDSVVRRAIARLSGGGSPKLDAFQTAMGSESQVRAAERVLRLDAAQ